jgi:CubicO group peptidase (beta-lactamase class C family)
MNRIATLLLLPALALPLAAAAQEGPTRLAVGRTHTADAVVEQADTFTLELDAGSFVAGVVTQETADISVSIRTPAGAGAGRVDASERGLERFFFDADSAGTYQLVVAPVDEAAGRYSIEVQRVEAIADDPSARVDQLMAHVDRDDVPGGVVAVVRNGEMIFSRAYGMADLTHGAPFRVSTPTNIGSTSKQFTGFALTLLDARGELSLEDDVRKHIPELPDFGPVITIRHLLSHTTGYREFVNLLALGGIRVLEGDYIDPAEIITVVQRQPELQNEPGAEFNYNNTAFGLATVVVERVTGQPFPTWMEENVFGPLGMHDSRVRSDPGEVIPGRARGYVQNKEEGWREVRDLGASMGAGGIYTTVEDLARWVANFETGKVGGPDIFERITTRNILTNGDTTSYGFGLFIDEYRGLARVHHGGNDVAHRSMLRYFPELRAGVVVQSNNATFNNGGIADQVVDLFFGDSMENASAAEDAVADGPEATPFDPDAFEPETFDAFAGRYALDEAPAMILRFWREDDRLLTEVTGQEPTELAPTSDSTFALEGVEAQVTFRRDEDGEVSLTLHQNGDHSAQRLEGTAWDPSQAELAAYTGRFYSTELETFYEVALEDDGLVLRQRRFADDVELRPGQQEDAFTGGFPVTEVAFERDDAGTVTGLRAGNGRSRDVWFERVGEGGITIGSSF